MTTLFIGRFQGFHNGHYKQIIEAVKATGNVVLCIGEASSLSDKNPFELRKVIDSILLSFSDNIEILEKVTIISVLDTSNEKWYKIISNVVSYYNVSHIAGKKKDVETQTYIDKIIEQNNLIYLDFDIKTNISATEIREKLKENDLDFLKAKLPLGSFKVLTQQL